MAEELVTVRVAQGQLRGRRATSSGGGRYYSFQGVPYAKPPVGPLRFKDPQAAVPWQGVRDALKEGDRCTQFDFFSGGGLVGSEDCLFVNVYAPDAAPIGGGGGTLLPTMVWLHGGGYAFGSGNTDLFGPDHLVQENVLLVTINYRLGPFGFLYLGHEAAPGNYGLKDQVAALRWVKDNIAAFGGDPDNVTLFGESAGGASVHYHLLSPLSKGLFRRAIAQSGVSLCPWARHDDAVETSRRLAAAAGMADAAAADAESVVAFLRGVDHEALLKAAQEAPLPKEKKRHMQFGFGPTEEVSAPGVEPLLPASHRRLVEEGRHHAVPLMAGVTSQEALVLFAFADLREATAQVAMDAAWEDNVLSETRVAIPAQRRDDALKELRRFFLQGNPISKDTLQGYLDMLSDLTFVEPLHHVVRRIAEEAKAPLFFYHFNLDGEYNWFKKFLKADSIAGACHGDENGYLFRVETSDPPLPADHPSSVGRRRLLRLWANFARTGNPTPGDDPLLGVHWEPYSPDKRHYLQIGDELRPGRDLYKERLTFWDNFYAKFGH